MLKAIVQPVTPFEQNASILYCSETKKCAIVDPGGDIEMLLKIAKDNELVPEKILLTHGHIDHAGGATEIAQILKVKIHGPHKDDKFLLDSLEEQGKMFGLNSKDCSPDVWLNEGDIVTIGKEKLETYFCPGHTPGHLIFYNLESKLAIVGDVLFCGSIGRTDLPGGNFDDKSSRRAPSTNLIILEPSNFDTEEICFLKLGVIGVISFLDKTPNLLNLQVSSRGLGQLLKSFDANFLKLFSSN